MSFFAPELAARRFQNLRPVRRAALVMWIVGILVLAFNIWLYATHFSALSDHHERLAELDARVEVEQAAVDRLEDELGGLDLDWQNRQVVLLNSLIEQRTFSWSDLIDHLAEVLPEKVRLHRLTPRISADRQRRGDRTVAEPAERRVELGISGSADNDDSLLKFIDALFSHPRFDGPVLAGESRGESGDVASFTMTVDYLPRDVRLQPTAEEAATEAEQPAADTADGEPSEVDPAPAAESPAGSLEVES